MPRGKDWTTTISLGGEGACMVGWEGEFRGGHRHQTLSKNKGKIGGGPESTTIRKENRKFLDSEEGVFSPLGQRELEGGMQT